MSDLNGATAYVVAMVLWDVTDPFAQPSVGVVLNPVGAGAQRVLRFNQPEWRDLRADWTPGATVWATPALLAAFAAEEGSHAAVR